MELPINKDRLSIQQRYIVMQMNGLIEEEQKKKEITVIDKNVVLKITQKRCSKLYLNYKVFTVNGHIYDVPDGRTQ